MSHTRHADQREPASTVDFRDLAARDAEGDLLRGYQHTVASEFARHRHEQGSTRCSCGGSWPCAAEEHAAWLLDWVYD